jgi:uncharacterized repeat protein (TIGR03803 family)
MRYRVLTVIAALSLATGALAQTENILANFNASNGGVLWGPVVLDKSGNIYGMAHVGVDDSSCGEIYEVVNDGGTYSLGEIHNFTCGDDGGNPYYNGLAVDSSGNLYGFSENYGLHGYGTVFELKYSGGTWKFITLYSFKGGAYGAYPYGAPAIDSKGVIYGTTFLGGGDGCSYHMGCGTVFTLTKKNGAWTEKVIHTFQGNGVDGYFPYAGSTLDSSGNVWGTTFQGGRFGYGTVYKLNKGKKGWSELIAHSFHGGSDGCNPYSGLAFDASGNVYGTAACDTFGAVYQLKKSGKKYTNNVILNFDNYNGYFPYDFGHVALDSSGNVYGTAAYGGAYKYGTVWRLAAGSWNYTDLHDFVDNGTDGNDPYSGLAIDSNGYLYGTTQTGGSGTDGTVYQIQP